MAETRLRKAVEIEKLVRWTYTEELTKEATSSAEGIWDHIALGTAHDDGRGRGSAQRYPHFGLPHPDAYTIAQAVTALPDLAANRIDTDWLMGDLVALYRERDAIMVRSLRTAALVVMHAKMGTRPDWYGETPQPQQTLARRGPGVELVGRCKGKNLYSAGSYCPLRWEPAPLEIAEGRADYAAWWRGLEILSQTLVLRDHDVLPPSCPADPWRTAEPVSAVHVVGSEVARGPKLPLKPQRERAGPPLRTRPFGPVRIVERMEGQDASS